MYEIIGGMGVVIAMAISLFLFRGQIASNPITALLNRDRTKQIAGGGGVAPGSGVVTLTRRTGVITALNTLTAIDQNAEGSSAPFQIPGNVSKIVRVIISAVHDYGAAVVSLATMTQIRLSGQGIGGGLHEFAGPGASIQGVTSGNTVAQFVASYDVNIPVTPGATPIIQAAISGDTAPGGSYIMCTLQFG